MVPYSLNIIRLSYSIIARLNRNAYEAITLFGRSFQNVLLCSWVLNYTTSPSTLARADSGCPVPLSFALLTASHMLSFPAGTKIFQFPAYTRTTIHGARFGDPGFKGWHAPTPGLSQLATTFFVVRAKPSSRWLKKIKLYFSSNQLQTSNLTKLYDTKYERACALCICIFIKQKALKKHKPLEAHVCHKSTGIYSLGTFI